MLNAHQWVGAIFDDFLPTVIPEAFRRWQHLSPLEAQCMVKPALLCCEQCRSSPLEQKLLSVKFSSGNADDRQVCKQLNKNMIGIFVADAGYISEDLEQSELRN